VVADGQLGRVRRDGREKLEGTETHHGADVRSGVLRGVAGAGIAGVPRLDPPLPTPGQYDVELILASDNPPEQMLQTVGAVLGAGWQSGKFLYVDTDLKIDLPERES